MHTIISNTAPIKRNGFVLNLPLLRNGSRVMVLWSEKEKGHRTYLNHWRGRVYRLASV